MDINEWLICLMFFSFLGLLMSGFPIAHILGGLAVIFAGLGYLADVFFDAGTAIDWMTVGLFVNRIYKLMDNWVLVALPMFVFMGLMLDKSQVAEKLLLSLQRLLSFYRGGLALAVVFIGVLLAASTGIIGASVVLLGVLSLPSMLKQGYQKELSLGVVGATGCLGILIPPSIMLVVISDQMALSVGDLFMGAVFPGLLLFILYVIYILSLSAFKSDAFPRMAEEKDRVGVKELLLQLSAPIALIVAVLGSVFFGIATPTEASGIGAFGATVLALINKKLNRRIFQEVSLETMKTTSFIFGIMIGASCFSLVLRELGGDEFIEGIIDAMELGPYGLLFFALAFVFLLGFFLDWIEITLIVLPLLAPLIAGIDFAVNDFAAVDQATLLWFTVLVAMTLQTSFLTPPVGFALFYLKGVCPPEIKTIHLYRGVLPFVLLQLIALGIVVAFPEIVTWLPAKAF